MSGLSCTSRGRTRAFVLNKTNANAIADALGEDTQDWRDGEILLFETRVEFQGKMMAGIRCRVPPRKSEPAPSEIDDDSPF
jgi:hypothetical protein